ncbi:MAG: threonine synthase [Gammaproteobacteria bacterium]|jgi:threonine synthase|nr:threonine synthase [Gammaproteobacteria bacterium]
MKSYVTHLECSASSESYPANKIHGLSNIGKPLLVRYDLEQIKYDLSKDNWCLNSEPGFWRYQALLPVSNKSSRISLGEVITPLIPLQKSATQIGGKAENIIVKDEGRLPTGSFKARGLALAVSMAHQFGLKHLAIPTNGNAGAALAAYAKQAQMKATVFCPDNTPEINVSEIQLQGADTYLVNGLINDCGKIVLEGTKKVGWFDVSTLKEPYRIEGKKTMGLELVEQMNWELPGAIIYPTGGGTGLIGMWKAFQELKALGWLTGNLPKMIAVQSTGCAPIVRAFDEGLDHAPFWEDAHTVASGIRVPAAIGDFLILEAIRESNGSALAVEDDHIIKIRDLIAKEDGLLLCPEGAATAAGYQLAIEQKIISSDEKVVLFNCATGLKYPMPKVIKKINKDDPINFEQFT